MLTNDIKGFSSLLAMHAYACTLMNVQTNLWLCNICAKNLQYRLHIKCRHYNGIQFLNLKKNGQAMIWKDLWGVYWLVNLTQNFRESPTYSRHRLLLSKKKFKFLGELQGHIYRTSQLFYFTYIYLFKLYKYHIIQHIQFLKYLLHSFSGCT